MKVEKDFEASLGGWGSMLVPKLLLTGTSSQFLRWMLVAAPWSKVRLWEWGKCLLVRNTASFTRTLCKSTDCRHTSNGAKLVLAGKSHLVWGLKPDALHPAWQDSCTEQAKGLGTSAAERGCGGGECPGEARPSPRGLCPPRYPVVFPLL